MNAPLDIPNPPPLRVGVVGCGRVAQHHLRFISESPRATLVGLVDANGSQLSETALRFGSPAQFASLEELLAEFDLDVLHVLTPPEHHFAHASLALDRGVNVLIEKPMTLTLAEAKELYALAERKGARICPDFTQLFHPLTARAREIVESGALGPVVHCSCEMYVDLNIGVLKETHPPHWSLRLPAGVLHDSLPHPLYMLMDWTGPPVRMHVHASTSGALPGNTPDALDLMLAGETVTGHAKLSLTKGQPAYRMEIRCEQGLVAIDFRSLVMTVSHKSRLPGPLARLISGPSVAWQLLTGTLRSTTAALRGRLRPYHGLKNLIDAYYGALSEGRPTPVSMSMGLAVAAVEERVAQATVRTPRAQRPAASSSVEPAGPLVLVTGASGFLGTRVVKALRDNGYQVNALCRPLADTRRLELTGAQIISGDLRDAACLRLAAQGVCAIVHLGAALQGSPEFLLATNVGGTEHVAAAARASAVSRVIYVSSLAVYDYAALATGEEITPDSALEDRPASRGTITLSKRLAEDVAREQLAVEGPSWTILRPAVFFGPGRSLLSLAGKQVGQTLVRFGRPSRAMRLLHVDDMAAAILATLACDSTMDQIYTLGHGDTLTTRQFITSFLQRDDPRLSVVFIPYSVGLGLSGASWLRGRMRGSPNGLSRARLAYGCASVRVNTSAFIEATGWAPSGKLLDQLEAVRLQGHSDRPKSMVTQGHEAASADVPAGSR